VFSKLLSSEKNLSCGIPKADCPTAFIFSIKALTFCLQFRASVNLTEQFSITLLSRFFSVKVGVIPFVRWEATALQIVEDETSSDKSQSSLVFNSETKAPIKLLAAILFLTTTTACGYPSSPPYSFCTSPLKTRFFIAPTFTLAAGSGTTK
jgi:hypothetical protein